MTDTTTDLTPMPVELLVRQAVDDGSDYDDGVGGYTGGTYDPTTKILTLKYERDEELPELDAEDGEPDEDYNHSTTEYRFKLIPDTTGEG